MQHEEYYRRLGVHQQADQRLIRDAYRNLVRCCHPDVHPTDPEAENRFKSINEAYQVLSDPEKRVLYDQFGQAWPKHEHVMVQSTMAAAPLPMANSIGTPPAKSGKRRRHMVVSVRMTLEEAFYGTTRRYHTGPAQIDVQIPSGVETGTRLFIPYAGGPGDVDTPAGDLLLEITVLPHQHFVRRGHDLLTVLTLDPGLAASGGWVAVPTLEHPIDWPLPSATAHGDTFRIVGGGMPHLYLPGRHGDLHVQIQLSVTGVTQR